MYALLGFLMAVIMGIIGAMVATTDFIAGMVVLGIAALIVICGTILEVWEIKR